MNKQSKNRGVSLIELLIVMAIVAIIAAVAYPSYQEYTIRARRVDGTGDAMALGQYLERVYTENGRYDQDRAGNPIVIPAGLLQSPGSGTNPHYRFTFTGGAAAPQNANTFNLTITPTSAIQQNDTRCGTLSLNEQGVRCALSGAHCSNSANNDDIIVVDRCW